MIAEGKHGKNITTETINYVYDEPFNDAVKEQIAIMDPICKLIQNCQSLNYSISDAYEGWQKIILSEEFNDVQNRRKDMALSIYCKAANFLDPRYWAHLMTDDDREEAEVFLIEELDASGIESFQEYKYKEGLFEKLNEKKISSPGLYWKSALASRKHSQLATLAIKLVTIPVSSAEIERVFSNWKFIHGPLRNKLDFEKSKKLVEIYYDLNKTDKLESDTSDDDE